MKKKTHGKILRSETKEQYINTIPEYCEKL